MALVLPSGISPRPGCGSDPRKKNSLPGSVVASPGLVLSRALHLATVAFCRSLFVLFSYSHSVLNLCLSSWVFGWIQCRAFRIQCPCTGALYLVAHRGHLDWEPCRSGERCCCCQTVAALATPVPACMGATSALTSKPATLAPPSDALRRSWS